MAEQAALDKIDAKFKALYPDRLITDGIIDIESFNRAKRKILWILKEANNPEPISWSLREFILNYLKDYKYWAHTFGLPCQISWAVLNGIEDLNKVPCAKDITDAMWQVAVINIKKTGGTNRADGRVIKQSYDRDKALIREQIEAIGPDIIINCSGIWDILTDFKTKGEISHIDSFRRAAYKDGVIINAYHPAQKRLSHRAYFKNIWDCLKQA
jgi:hypothetical protein